MNRSPVTKGKTYESISTGIAGSADGDDIRLSLTALEKIKQIKIEKAATDDFFVRLGIRGGGENGAYFFLEFDNLKLDGDKVFNVSDIDFVIDARSLFYLMGITIDYVTTDDGQGFVFSETKDIEEMANPEDMPITTDN